MSGADWPGKLVGPQRGAATVEFYIVAFFAFIPLLMAILQLGMFMMAKNTVNTAALGVARAGGASGGDKTAMLNAFATGVMPLYASTGLKSVNGSGGDKEVTAGNYPMVYTLAMTRAMTEVRLPTNSITVLNPSAASFRDFGINRAGVGRIIPHTNLDIDRNVVGAASGQTRADALLLKIELRYCYEMVFPIIDAMITQTLRLTNTSPSDQACYGPNPFTKRRGIPIRSQAVVRMTVPPVQGRFP